jgi:hypothetical protein
MLVEEYRDGGSHIRLPGNFSSTMGFNVGMENRRRARLHLDHLCSFLLKNRVLEMV